MIKFRS